MCKDKIITGLDVTRQMSKARQILNNQVIPRAELHEIRKSEGKLSTEYKSGLSTKQESGFDQLKIDSAKYLTDYAIRIKFSDGTDKLVDFKPFLSKSLHPAIKKYLDEQKFSSFILKDGNLNWNDYDLIFPIWDLYNGNL